ncbi:hypothetical protein [Glaciecola sp. SC05]|uniref:hypothetical protein n=1 Tax=Glaciecola sp. SC05 TaxID=1987355 RepID=UPI003529202E
MKPHHLNYLALVISDFGCAKIDLIVLAKQANINPKEVTTIVEGLMDNLSNAEAVLKNANVSSVTSKAIISTINNKWVQLKEHI